MKEILHRESIAYNELDEILDHADADPSHVAAGVVAIQTDQLPEGITLLAGNGKLGFFNADSRTLKIWPEKDMVEVRPSVIDEDGDDFSQTEALTQPEPQKGEEAPKKAGK